MGGGRRIAVWSRAADGGPPSGVVEALRAACPDVSTHRGNEPPAEPADVLLIWADAADPDVERRALEAQRSGLAAVVMIAAPGSHGMVRGESRGEPSHIVRLDPGWEPAAVTTLVEGALAGAMECVRARALAETQESFVAIASHDLRTPVSTLRLLHDLFRSKLTARTEPLGPGELSDFDEFLSIMERCLEKMDGLIGDILETWRLYRGPSELVREPVSLNAVAEDIVAGMFPAAMKKDIALDLIAEPSLGPVMAERRRVGQVVANFVENAIKYAPPGGAVTVRTCPAPGGGGAVLEVADSGPGVPEEERGRLFRRFGRGSAKTTGGEPSTGLGLFICREIVEQYGGRVWFEPVNAPGCGSRFFAFWPSGDSSPVARDGRRSEQVGGGDG